MFKYLLVFSACVAAAYGASCTDNNSYDYFELVMQWPPVACEQFHCHNSNDYFTLHGLWPNDYNGDYPCYCTNEHFEPNAIDSLRNEMDKYWPSLAGSNDGFWSHEWEKHGTCAEDVQPLSSEYGFFSTVLTLRSKYDPLSILANAGISPGRDSYSKDDMHDAFTHQLGVNVAFSCSGGDLAALTMCIDKDLKPMKCPSNVDDSGCGSHIGFPSSTPSRLLRGSA